MTTGKMALACAAGTVAAVLIAIGAGAAWALPLFRPMPLIWCFVPLAWCIWATLAPATWVPGKLPLWGALLGVIAWLSGAMILNVPARMMGLELPLLTRALAIVPVTVLYYLFWMAVRDLYVRLSKA